jgi:hypothetical protein
MLLPWIAALDAIEAFALRRPACPTVCPPPADTNLPHLFAALGQTVRS